VGHYMWQPSHVHPSELGSGIRPGSLIGIVIQELNKLGINRIVILAYNSKGNSIIK